MCQVSINHPLHPLKTNTVPPLKIDGLEDDSFPLKLRIRTTPPDQNRILRVPIPSERNRIIGYYRGNPGFLGHTNGSLGFLKWFPFSDEVWPWIFRSGGFSGSLPDKGDPPPTGLSDHKIIGSRLKGGVGLVFRESFQPMDHSTRWAPSPVISGVKPPINGQK